MLCQLTRWTVSKADMINNVLAIEIFVQKFNEAEAEVKWLLIVG